MKKTLLLCFIHGFKGGEDTFGAKSEFAQHLAGLISAELPKVTVRAITYPKYETRGDLHECVLRFRDWLYDRVVDLEVANGATSKAHPSVRTILVGHSMGGIVAAETIISLMREDERRPGRLSHLMFPYVQGVLAFDTPYLGIAPGVLAHGAEDHYNNAVSALSQLSSITTLWGAGTAAKEKPPAAAPKQIKDSRHHHHSHSHSQGHRHPQAHERTKSESSTEPSKNNNNNNGGGWGNLGKIAMFAGAAGALVAGGAAAYLNREHITTGWTWVSSHLEFVGCLGRAEELKTRVNTMVRLNEELHIGFANLYTRLGRAADSKQISMIGTVFGNQRTFCNIPKEQPAGVWMEAVNDAATDETGAHMSMFEAKSNPGYAKLSKDAKDLVVSWTKNEWYESSGHRGHW